MVSIRLASWPNRCAVPKNGVVAEESPQNHQINCTGIWYDCACAFVGVQPLSARRYELGSRFFRSVTQSDSCLHDLLPKLRDSEILSRCNVPA